MNKMGIGIKATDKPQEQTKPDLGTYSPISDDIHASIAPTTEQVQIAKDNPVEDNPYYQEAKRMRYENEVVTDDTMRKDEFMMESARVIMAKDNPEDIELWSDEEIMTGFMTKLNRLNYNIPRAISAGVEYDDASDEEKAALMYGLEQYDNKEMSWDGAMGAVWGVATDPSSWLSVASLGLGTPAKAGANVGARELLKQSLLRTPNLLGIEGAVYAGGAAMADENLKMTVDENREFDATQVGLATAIGGVAGKGIGEAGEWAAKKIGQAYSQGEKLAMKSAGGGMPSFDSVLANIKDLAPREQQKQLQGTLRYLEGEDKAKAIAHMKTLSKAQPKKVKPKKVQEVITAREDFNEKFYSRAEHAYETIRDNTKNVSKDENFVKKMKDMGVKQDELDALGIVDTDNYDKVGYKLRDRNDKITKNTLDADTAGSLIDEYDYMDYISVDEGTSVSTGEAGYGAKLSDEYTGQEVEVGASYYDDIYTDGSGTEFDWDEMRNDWYKYYSSDYREDAIAKLKEQGFDEPDEGIIMNTTLELADDDAPWYDNYYQKEYFESELDNERYDTMDEAIEDTKRLMYADYVDRAEYAGGDGEIFESYTIDGGGDYRMEVYQMEDFSGDGTTHYEPHLEQINQPAENVQVHARMKKRVDDNGKEGTVLEEVQSQWEQDWRKEGGGKKLPTPAERAVAQKTVDKIDAETNKLGVKIEALDTKEQKIVSKQDSIRAKLKTEAAPKIENLNKQIKDLDEQIQGVQKEWEADPDMDVNTAQDKVRELKNMQYELEAKIDNVETEYKTDEEFVKLQMERNQIRDNRNDIRKEANQLNLQTRPYRKIVDAKPPSTSTPPIQNRTQYTKVAMLDNLTQSIENGEDYFGWINGHIQNGSKIDTTVGMSQAYDIEMPRIIQKQTGLTPYMANFDDGLPTSGDKIKWDGKRAMDLEYYNDLSEGEEWYWRVDYDKPTKDKLKDAKIEMYGVGGVSLIGATQGEDNEN